MTIRANVQAIADRIQQEIDAKAAAPDDPNVTTELTNDVQQKSIRAIFGGYESEDWEAYMRLFATDADELAKLRPTPEMSDAKRTALAYLVANGMCGTGTTGALADNVTDTTDMA